MADSTITLRPADADDCELVFRWANDPAVRAASFSTQAISLDSHREWYQESLRGARRLFIAEREDQPIGLTRLDPIDDDTFEVSLLLDNQNRGRGLAVPVLNALLELAERSQLGVLMARVRVSNLRSRRVFERAGFQLVGEEVIHGVEAVRYTCAISKGNVKPGKIS